MRDWSDVAAAAHAAMNPATSSSDLDRITQAHRGLQAQIAAHPNVSSDQLGWLASQEPLAAQTYFLLPQSQAPASSSPSGTSATRVAGTILLISGALGATWAGVTIADDIWYYDRWVGWWGYNYQTPLTSHEMMVISALVISVVVVAIGLITTTTSRQSRAE